MTTGMAVGELVVETSYDGENLPEMKILRADPRIRISNEFMASCVRGYGDRRIISSAHHWFTLVDDVLTVRGINRTVVYRINFADWDALTDSYFAEWPD